MDEEEEPSVRRSSRLRGQKRASPGKKALPAKQPKVGSNDSTDEGIELDIPELAAPRSWTQLLSAQPSSSRQAEQPPASDSEDEEEDEWEEVGDAAEAKPRAVEVRLDVGDLENRAEKALKQQLEKLDRELKADICKVGILLG